MTSVPNFPPCPDCNGTGEVVLLHSTVPCEKCLHTAKKIVFPLFKSLPKAATFTAEYVASEPMTLEEPDMSFGDYRHALEQARKELRETQEGVATLLAELHQLTGWFRENAPDMAEHGGTVDDAIAYMERLRATQDPCATGEHSWAESKVIYGTLIERCYRCGFKRETDL